MPLTNVKLKIQLISAWQHQTYKRQFINTHR